MGRVTDFNEVQDWNALVSILLSEFDICKLIKPLQFWKAPSPILVIELGRSKSTRPLQPEKAYIPIQVTEEGILISCISEHSKNAQSSIEETSLGIIDVLQPMISLFELVSIMALQLFRESKTGFSLSTTIDSSALHPEKAPLPINDTVLGIVTLFSWVQCEKAPSPI